MGLTLPQPTRKKKPRQDSWPFWAWDLEALDWNRFRVAAAVSSEGDVETFRSLEGLATFLQAQERRCFAHFGGRYDFFFLPPLQQVVLSGSGILKAQHGRARLYDTWMLFQMSLAKIGKAVGLEKFEGKSDRIHELTMEETEEHCVQDCRVLARALEQHQKWTLSHGHPQPRWPPTAGSTAVFVEEALEPELVRYLGNQMLSVEDWYAMSASVSGGRVENHHVGIVEGVHTYDINSSYPMSWIEAPLPLGPWEAVDHEVEGLPGVYLAEVNQHGGHLPVVAPDHRWRYRGEAWCTSEELSALRAAGGVARVSRGWVSRKIGWLGQRFVQDLYAQKKAGSPWAKVSINSLHGKLCQGLWQGAHYRTRDGRYVKDEELSLPAWYQRPLIGAFVLARARLRLWSVMDALELAGWRVLYNDTDSVHTDCPPELFPGQLGEECGQWKYEGAAERAVYVAPKVYGLQLQGGKRKVVCKGFPPKAVSFETLERAARGERVSIRDRGGLVSFLSQGSWGAAVASLNRTLSVQTGGKHRGIEGRLLYPDHHRARRTPRSAA